ncbi:MAG: peptide chain release factor N(5)-glutamine methyltransferase [Oligoflexales bacterium]|nr:peptide chain release factor N(5)-glutamine methyltransferase [Oligoflexales bacterium]
MNAKLESEKNLSIIRALDLAIGIFKEKNIISSRTDAEVLLAGILSRNITYLYANPEVILDKNKLEDYWEFVNRRSTFEPVAYILGEKWFYGHKFYVDANVLIPRPETEILVELVLKECSFRGIDKSLRLLDLGTGSGCISISLALAKNFYVESWEISLEAIKVAIKNDSELGAGVKILQKDMRKSDSWLCDQSEKFDIIVSNPPYVDRYDKELSESVIKFEPGIALFAESEGLEFFEIIAKNSSNVIKPGGKVFLEMGYSQHKKVKKIFEDYKWKNVKILKDLNGINRFISADFKDT